MHQDEVTGWTLLAGCGLSYGLTTTFRAVPTALSQNLPPTFFPRLVLLALAILGLALIAGHHGRRRDPRERVAGRVFVTAALLVATLLLIELLGMLPTIGLFLLVLPPIWGERRIRWICSLALGVPLLVYLVFSLALGIRFPAGYLGSIFF